MNICTIESSNRITIFKNGVDSSFEFFYYEKINDKLKLKKYDDLDLNKKHFAVFRSGDKKIFLGEFPSLSCAKSTVQSALASDIDFDSFIKSVEEMKVSID